MQYYTVLEVWDDGSRTHSPPLERKYAENLRAKLERQAIGNWPQYSIHEV